VGPSRSKRMRSAAWQGLSEAAQARAQRDTARIRVIELSGNEEREGKLLCEHTTRKSARERGRVSG
jgi:hypothetical protein